MCRAWQAILLSPPLLANVTISAHFDEWLEVLEGGTSWLARRAADSVRQLTINIGYIDELEQPEAVKAAALITGALAAVGSGGMLREVTVWLGDEMPLPLGGWAAALHSLQQLAIHSNEGCISVSGDLRGMSALQSLDLLSSAWEFAAAAQLPPTLTSLSLGASPLEPPGNALPPQVGLLALVWRVVRA